MTTLSWTWFGSPGDVVATRPGLGSGVGPARLDVGVLTMGRELWVRRIEGTGARWEARGPVPGDSIGPQLVAVLEPGPVEHPMIAVASLDIGVGVSQYRRGAPRWTTLAPTVSGEVFAPGWSATTGERLLLVVVGGRIWLALLGVASTGALAVALEEAPDVPDDLVLEYWAILVTATPGPGLDAVAHVVANVYDQERGESGLLIGFPDGPADESRAQRWTWVTPPAPPGGMADLRDAATVTSAGEGEACVVFGPSPSDGPVRMLRGGGRTWRWEDLGRPTGVEVIEPRAASSTTAPGGTRVPWVLGTDERLAGHRWTPGDGWTTTGRLPENAWLPPGGAVASSAGEPWLTGVAGGGDLWVCPPTGPPANHGGPRRIVDVLGAFLAPHAEARDRPAVLDDRADLWTWGDSGWVNHGRPGTVAAVVAVAGTVVRWSQASGIVGSSALVADAGGRLWEFGQDGLDGGRWLDHGPPPSGAVAELGRPIADEGGLVVPVLTDDGRVYVVGTASSPPSWQDRGEPGGFQIFGLVGAGPVTEGSATTTVVTVVTSSGLWVHRVGPGWTSLGTPPVPSGQQTNGVAGGIGVIRGEGASGWELGSVVVDKAEGRVWACTWPGGVWADLGRPPGPRIVSGSVAESAFGGGARIGVVTEDGGLWVRIDTEWIAGGRPPTAEKDVPASRVRVSPSWSGIPSIGVLAQKRLWVVDVEVT